MHHPSPSHYGTADDAGSGKAASEAAQRCEKHTEPVPERRFLKGGAVPNKKFLKDDSIDPSDKIIALMRSDPTITTLTLGKALGISDRAVRKRITRMREAGLILRTGGRKAGRWEVLK
jgi:predicted HTH transcriptional regulator